MRVEDFNPHPEIRNRVAPSFDGGFMKRLGRPAGNVSTALNSRARKRLVIVTGFLLFAVGLYITLPGRVARGAGNACAWSGATSTDWATAGNWNTCGGVTPTSADTVSIGTATNQPTVSSAVGSVGAITISSGGTLTVSSGGSITTTASMTLGGGLTVSGGTINVGNSSGNFLTISSTATLNVQSGTLNVAGRLLNSGGTLTMSSGTLNTCTVGLSNNGNASFEMSATSKLTMSGGTVVFQNANASGGGD